MCPHLIIDNFLDDPDSYRALALKQDYYTIRGPDGGTYKNISIRKTEEHKEEIEKAVGKKISQDYSFLRFATFGSELNHTTHADSGLSPWGAVLYLNTPDQIVEGSGTGFFEHKILKIEKVPTEHEIRSVGKSPKRVWTALENSWNDCSKWRETGRCEMSYNRCVIFPTDYFHSRLPVQAFGSTIEDARLVFVSFFNIP